MPKCKACGDEYNVKVNEVDDGCCCFDCWEINNVGQEPLQATIVDDEDTIML